ncbi:MAG: hypothetical protein KA218_07770 [Arenimonas sp.]|nr:hypothetical protein [Arenimonas sp.]
MRKVFSAARLENVEEIERLFNEAGIVTKIIGGRSFKGHSRRGFTYNDRDLLNAGPPPELWVLHADDYRKAREILLQQGLLETQQETSSYVPESYRPAPRAAAKPAGKLHKARMVLLVAVIGLIVIQGLRLLVQAS